MDVVLALDGAACILAVTEFITGLLSTSQASQTRPPLLSESRGDYTTLEAFEDLRIALLNVQIHPLQYHSSTSNALALKELISSRDASAALLKDIINTLRESPGQPRSQPWDTDARAWLRSRLTGTLYIEKLRQLSNVVSRQVKSIMSSRISEVSQTVTSSDNERRYAGPEQESRIDAMTRSLEDLKIEAQKWPVNLGASSPVIFKEAEVKQIRIQLTDLTESENAFLADGIVSSLNYDSRPVRLDSVPQAHKDTFQWAFDSHLSDWFLSGRGTFWISGRPGSGKSTFMKFISKHPQTTELLTHWAGSPDTLAVAAHFFWIAGTPIQKSWQGLLQSLLFDLLRGRPHVISLVSRIRWAAAKVGKWQVAAEPWSVSELTAVLRALSIADTSLKMCFFIDGLDEYDSNHAELCEVLRIMANSPHIKMCLSSRRWSVFEKSFGNNSQKSLDIHELTRGDIRRFVNDQLETHPRWTAEVSEEVSLEKAELVNRIVAQADGVFLWAFFVTRSLREGLSKGERIGDLNRRFRHLPSDLDQLFQHMLESVDPADHPKMAGFLQAAIHALEPLHVDLYWHLEKEFERHSPTNRGPSGPGPPEDMFVRRKQAINSINEKTKGLLRLVDNRVEFLHRTVKDFVLTKDTGSYLSSKLPASYNGFVSIAAAYLGFLRTERTSHPFVPGVIRQGLGLNTGPFIAHLNQALVYVSEALKQADQHGAHQYQQIEELLEECEATIQSMVSLSYITIKGVNAQSCDPRLLFREELLRHELTPYLAKKITEQPGYFDVFDESPLFAALMPMSRSSGESPAPVPTVLDLLLERGEDPNVRPRQSDALGVSDVASPWVLFARSTMSVFNMLSGPCMFPALRWNNSLKDATFGRLISHGADPNAPLLDCSNARTVFSHFLDISLSRFLGEECFEDYLGTLDAFLRAGASLGVPDLANKVGSESEVAVGNLARRRPEESVLASFCTELKGLMTRLAADPCRAAFVSSIVEKLILHCSDKEDLRELEMAISQGCPTYIAAPLLRLIVCELSGQREQGSIRKRQPNEDLDNGDLESRIKHFRRL
ncbi:uncharacterized protein F4822DRAFT_245105 [Hypoxylon trugodes]|uniref:uncharacterized protein n=1 Tax=Hypoxylon trugodes TaxID=326681 RepID=UPI00218E120F|nr:uncharacterized protein F4822DRAFT_245105 [Hypoxylon trugodes]KAI1388393.1 hypothetical protein F4822DRAFT_245105 [Hypoxylon trugodes]